MELRASEEKRLAAEESVFRLERRVSLLQKECESLKAMLATYAAEVRCVQLLYTTPFSLNLRIPFCLLYQFG